MSLKGFTSHVPLSPQSWADAFRSSPDLTGVVAVYEDLRRKGLEFPMTDLDMLSPIHTPQRVRRLGDSEEARQELLSAAAFGALLGLTDPAVCPLDRFQLRDTIRTEFCGH